jgi:arylsulfatase A-like enzyme
MTSRAAAMLLMAVILGGCGPVVQDECGQMSFGIDFPPPGPDEKPTAFVFVVDGVNRDVFDRMLAEGRLPNIKKYFVDRGLYCDRCVANVPSVTLVNEVSIVTSVFSGRHGVLGNDWFDRSALFNRNYDDLAEKNLLDADYRSETLFERLADETTMSLFYQAHRGASKFAENWTSAGPPYFFGMYGMVDHISLWRFEIVANVARAQGRFPALVVAYLLAPDMEAYRNGVSSEAYRAALEHDDTHIGLILQDLQNAGRLDHTVLALVSDHGMVDVSRHWPLEKFLSDDLRLGVAPELRRETVAFEDRLAYFDQYEAVVQGSGERFRAVYLRKPLAAGQRPDQEKATDLLGGFLGVALPFLSAPAGATGFENWLGRPTPQQLRAYPSRDGKTVDLIARLVDSEAVDVVAFRAGPGKVHVVTKNGEVELSRPYPDSRSVACRILRGEDPLGYAASKAAELMDGRPHAPAKWLTATADTPYPDLVPQVLAYFDAHRAGDLAVFAASGWDLGHENKGGHGGLGPGDMCTVMLLAGPGVPHERRSGAVRSVDLGPTILQLLGRPVPADIDGRSLLGR